MLKIREYVAVDGRSPFRVWLQTLDVTIKARVQARVLRFESGNLGDHKNLGGGIWEARLTFGAGYRIYFGRIGNLIVLLLTGGDKGSQTADIRDARRFWAEYLEATSHGEKK